MILNNSSKSSIAISTQRFADAAIEMRDVKKQFHIYQGHNFSMREFFIQKFGRVKQQNSKLSEFSLQDISLSIGYGETWALIGHNGAGKSTLLRLMAGIYWPNEGRVILRGRVAALIGLGAGLHPDLTGNENIYLYGNILGFKNDELKGLYDNIVQFSDIKEFMSTPVKYYSSGMRMRLAFAIATAVEPDILLLDEILAVGDAGFRDRCFQRIQGFQDSGCTIVIATHDLQMAETFASKSIWIDKGRILKKGKVVDVVEAYLQSFQNRDGS
jgi:ABC-type polysaccharide/polyol phosphate transport system ATPase subunit